MSRPLAIVAAAGLMFFAGCEKKQIDTIPLVAPEPATSAADVLKHLQYAMVRKDPKHLEAFAPEDKDKFLGATTSYHDRAGVLGIKLSEEEIEALGVQDFVQKGYLSPNWTRRELDAALKDLDSGKTLSPETMKALQTVNQSRLDMPRRVIPDKKIAEKLIKDLTDAIDENPKAIYAAGLYRILKAIPEHGWQYIEATVAANANGIKNMNDVLLNVGETRIVAIPVGHNPDGKMFVWNFTFDKYPAQIARMFPEPPGDGK